MKRLVVVADNSLIVEAITIGLKASGEFTVESHLDGHNASAEVIAATSPDVVLIDDLGQSGEVLRLIREIKTEGLIVIVLTLSMDPDWLGEVFDAGASGAISKATHPVALTTLVRETVDGHVLHVHKRSTRARAARPESVARSFSLTPRELEVLNLVASGASNGEIAQALWVTEQTVKFHLSNVYRKLGVNNRTEASHYAHVNGLAGVPPSVRVLDGPA